MVEDGCWGCEESQGRERGRLGGGGVRTLTSVGKSRKAKCVGRECVREGRGAGEVRKKKKKEVAGGNKKQRRRVEKKRGWVGVRRKRDEKSKVMVLHAQTSRVIAGRIGTALLRHVCLQQLAAPHMTTVM